MYELKLTLRIQVFVKHLLQKRLFLGITNGTNVLINAHKGSHDDHVFIRIGYSVEFNASNWRLAIFPDIKHLKRYQALYTALSQMQHFNKFK